MNFVKHSNLEGQHAFLGASKYHWINYDEIKLAESYRTNMASVRGTELHELAAKCIKLGINLPTSKLTLNMFVNDAIGYGMVPEQTLYYSSNCFGTADAICFDEKNKFLRIHDLKTGEGSAHMEQLFIYEALFCLEYHYKPGEIQSELRIYQFDDIFPYVPTVDEITRVIDKIQSFDKIIEKIKQKET